MRLYLSIVLLEINCAVSTAQSYLFKGLDLDTGANLTKVASFNKVSKEIVITSTALLWHKPDSFNRYYTKAHFTKLDSINNISIDKYIENKSNNFGIRGNIKLKQGGYLGYGNHYNPKSQNQGLTGLPGCLILYNDNGDTIFTKIYHYGRNYSTFRSIRQLKDSSIVLVSYLLNDSNLFTALRVIKLDVNFNTTFDNIYYYSLNINRSEPRISSFVDAIEETEDGGLLIGSSILTRTADTVYHALLFKIDSNGFFLWERRYEFEEDMETEIIKIVKLQDRNFLLVGYYNEFWRDPNVIDKIFLIKVSPNGTLISKKLVHAYMYHYVLDALEKPNGDLLLAGTFAKGLNGFDYKAGLICLNNRGNIKWHRQFELPTNMSHTQFESSDLTDIELANDVTIMAVGNIFVIDSTLPYNNGGNQDILFLYTDSNGCVDPTNCSFTAVEEEYTIPYYFQTFPNPSNGLVKFSTNIPLASSARIKIYNSLGQLMLVRERIDFTEELDLRTFAKGMYVLEIQSKEFRNTQKLLIE